MLATAVIFIYTCFAVFSAMKLILNFSTRLLYLTIMYAVWSIYYWGFLLGVLILGSGITREVVTKKINI